MVAESSNSHVGRARGDGGFTLLETLIALVLLAFLMLLLPSSLKLATAIWATGDRLEKNMAAAVLLERLRISLQEAREDFTRSTDGSLRLQFDGDRNRLSFIALAQSGPAKAGMYTFQLEPIEDREPPQGLVFSQTAYRPHLGPHSEGGLKPSVSRRLVNSRLSFAYYGPEHGGGKAAWHDEWRDRLQLPELVALHLEPVDPGRGQPQRLVIPLRLGKRSIRAAP